MMGDHKRCPIAYAGIATVTVSGMFAYCDEDDCAWWTGSRCGVLRLEPVCAETPPYAMYHAPKHWHWVKTDRYKSKPQAEVPDRYEPRDDRCDTETKYIPHNCENCVHGGDKSWPCLACVHNAHSAAVRVTSSEDYFQPKREEGEAQ